MQHRQRSSSRKTVLITFWNLVAHNLGLLKTASLPFAHTSVNAKIQVQHIINILKGCHETFILWQQKYIEKNLGPLFSIFIHVGSELPPAPPTGKLPEPTAGT